MDLTVCSANVLHAKAPWRPLADVVGWQEADQGSWQQAARGSMRERAKVGEAYGMYVPALPASRAVTITWGGGWSLAKPLDDRPNQGCVQTHKGRRMVTPHRYVAWVILERDGQVIAHVNSHYISGVRGKGKWPVSWRRAMWARHHAALCKIVGGLRLQGLPVVVTGDFNRAGRDVTIAGLKRLSGSRGIDHILVSPEFTPVSCTVLSGEKAGSDHAPVRARLLIGEPKPKPPEDVVTDDRYELTTHDGKTVDRMTKQALEKAERKLGYPLTIVQGSYHRGVSQSAGTHDGGGVIDLAPWDWERKVKVLREIGFAAWHRTPAQGPWGEHCHAVLIGNEKASPSAKRQVDSYKAGRNGLAGNGLDDFWRPKVIKAYKYTPPPPPSRVSVFRKTVEEALAVTLPQIDAIERPAAYRMLKAVQAALDAGPKA